MGQEYLRALRILARRCKFKDTVAATTSDNYIRDAFVAGILSQPTRLRLLESKALTLQETIDLSDSMEGAVRDTEAYSSANHPGHTDDQWPITGAAACAIQKPSARQSTRHPKLGQPIAKCYFCGGPKHSRKNCPAHSAICNACEKKGHYAAVCQAQAATKACRAAYTKGPPDTCEPRAPPSYEPSSFAAACGQWAPPFYDPTGTPNWRNRCNEGPQTESSDSGQDDSDSDRSQVRREPDTGLFGTRPPGTTGFHHPRPGTVPPLSKVDHGN